MQSKTDGKALIKQFFNFEGDTLILELTYDSLSDLVNPSFSQRGKTPILSTEFFDLLEYCFAAVSKKQAVSLKVDVKEKEGMDEKGIGGIIQSNLSLKLLELHKQNRSEIFHAIKLLILGSTLLLCSYLFNQATSERLLFDVMTILGWVVVWESGTHFILNRAVIHRKKKKYHHLSNKEIHVA